MLGVRAGDTLKEQRPNEKPTGLVSHASRVIV